MRLKRSAVSVLLHADPQAQIAIAARLNADLDQVPLEPMMVVAPPMAGQRRCEFLLKRQLPEGDPAAGTARTINRFGADPTW